MKFTKLLVGRCLEMKPENTFICSQVTCTLGKGRTDPDGPTVNSVHRKAANVTMVVVPWQPSTPTRWALPYSARVHGHVVIFCGMFVKVYLIQHPFFDLVLGSS